MFDIPKQLLPFLPLTTLWSEGADVVIQVQQLGAPSGGGDFMSIFMGSTKPKAKYVVTQTYMTESRNESSDELKVFAWCHDDMMQAAAHAQMLLKELKKDG